MLSLAWMLASSNVASQERAKAIMKAIVAEAKSLWGEDWFPALVRKYCEIELAEGGDPTKVTPLNRRSQILFLTEEAKADGKQNPKLETLLKLADAVGAEMQLVFTRQEVKRF